MAGALLAREFADAGADVHIETAGFLESGHEVPDGVHHALARDGLDVAGHTSCQVTAGMVAEADLVVVMERSHVRKVAVLAPDAWSRTFTFKELVRRGEHIGARRANEAPGSWVRDAHRGRRPDDLLGADDGDNLTDPMGQSQKAFDRTADELGDLSRRLAKLLVAPDAGDPAGVPLFIS